MVRTYCFLTAVCGILASPWVSASEASGRLPLPPGLSLPVETVAEVLETVGLPDGGRTTRLVPATDLAQGQVVFYTVVIHNPGSEAAHNVMVIKPVPANTHYVADSAAAPGAEVTFSIDGGVTFVDARKLLNKDVRGVNRPVSTERYTHIRWRMTYPLAPGARAYARFRAVFR